MSPTTGLPPDARQAIRAAADALDAIGGHDETVAGLWRVLATCYDCGRQYGDEHGFPDLIVPRDVWLAISPTGHEGGLLCPSCICARAHAAGVQAHAVFRSGPFCASGEVAP